jgi:hypothetical protein
MKKGEMLYDKALRLRGRPFPAIKFVTYINE